MTDEINFIDWLDIKEEIQDKPLKDQIMVFVYCEQSIGCTDDIITEFRHQHSIINIENACIELEKEGKIAFEKGTNTNELS